MSAPPVMRMPGLELSIPEETLEVLAQRVAARLADASTGADTGPPAYTVATLAAALELSEKTVRGAIARGELPAVKRGGRYLIARHAVEVWATPDVAAGRARRGSRSRSGDRRPLSAAVLALSASAVAGRAGEE